MFAFIGHVSKATWEKRIRLSAPPPLTHVTLPPLDKSDEAARTITRFCQRVYARHVAVRTIALRHHAASRIAGLFRAIIQKKRDQFITKYSPICASVFALLVARLRLFNSYLFYFALRHYLKPRVHKWVISIRRRKNKLRKQPAKVMTKKSRKKKRSRRKKAPSLSSDSWVLKYWQAYISEGPREVSVADYPVADEMGHYMSPAQWEKVTTSKVMSGNLPPEIGYVVVPHIRAWLEMAATGKQILNCVCKFVSLQDDCYRLGLMGSGGFAVAMHCPREAHWGARLAVLSSVEKEVLLGKRGIFMARVVLMIGDQELVSHPLLINLDDLPFANSTPVWVETRWIMLNHYSRQIRQFVRGWIRRWRANKAYIEDRDRFVESVLCGVVKARHTGKNYIVSR